MEKSNSGQNGITDRQKRAIPFLIFGGPIQGNCEAAKISKATYFNWAKSEPFRNALARARDEAAREALENLKAGIIGAVQGLLELSKDDSDRWLKFRSCTQILSLFFKAKELIELEERLCILEKKLK